MLEVNLHQRKAAVSDLDLDRVAGLEQGAGDVAGLAVDHDVAMRNHLPGAGPRRGPAEAVYDVVKPPLNQAEQGLAGVFRGARGHGEEASKLVLEKAVEPLEPLLLPQAHAELAE